MKYFCLAQYATDLIAVRSQKSNKELRNKKTKFFIRIGGDTKPLFHISPKV